MSYLRIWIWATFAFAVCAALMTWGYFDIEGKLPASPPLYFETRAGLMAFVTVASAAIKWLFLYRAQGRGRYPEAKVVGGLLCAR